MTLSTGKNGEGSNRGRFAVKPFFVLPRLGACCQGNHNTKPLRVAALTKLHSKIDRGEEEEPTKAYGEYVEECDEETTKVYE